MVVALAFLGCGAGECTGGGAGEYASFPDAERILFAPDDRFALVVRRDVDRISIERFDLERRKAAWRVELPVALAGFSFASGGARFVVVEPVPGTARSRIGVYRSSDGQREAQLEREGARSAPEVLRVETSERVALSGDGRWLAVAGKSAFDLYALPGGKRVLHEQGEGHWPMRVRFDAGATRLALAQRAPDQPAYREVVVFERADDRWGQVAALGGAAEPDWTTAGLLVLRETGIDRWRDGASQPRIEFKAGLVPLRFSSDGGRSAHYAPDGRYAVVESPRRFVITDLESGRIVYERSLTGGQAEVKAAAISDTRATVFFGEELEGRLVRIDLSTGEPDEERRWGPLGKYTRPLFKFGERKPWKPAYWPHLSATGRYLAIQKPDAGYRLHLLD